ncbi:hypothetical protein PUN28_016821 [Cardiocondyla obscurior]|uniref:Uncharacterized protein n=1 Tax=Cardiocondyla obscurior TaxID=286306 RepID=A0AAW2EU89_9HYME
MFIILSIHVKLGQRGRKAAGICESTRPSSARKYDGRSQSAANTQLPPRSRRRCAGKERSKVTRGQRAQRLLCPFAINESLRKANRIMISYLTLYQTFLHS